MKKVHFCNFLLGMIPILVDLFSPSLILPSFLFLFSQFPFL